jgi:hypothetical protein
MWNSLSLSQVDINLLSLAGIHYFSKQGVHSYITGILICSRLPHISQIFRKLECRIFRSKIRDKNFNVFTGSYTITNRNITYFNREYDNLRE